MQVGRGPNTEKFKEILTGNASWAGPQHREFRKEILQAMQVGGAPHREFRKEILQVMQVGRKATNFAKISFLFICDVKIFKKIMPLTKYSVNV